jgi:hypothetical protein
VKERERGIPEARSGGLSRWLLQHGGRAGQGSSTVGSTQGRKGTAATTAKRQRRRTYQKMRFKELLPQLVTEKNVLTLTLNQFLYVLDKLRIKE